MLIRPPGRCIDLLTWIQSSSVNLIGGVVAAAAPFAQNDWRNPRGPARSPQREVSGLNPNLFGGGLKPFGQADWPNPGRGVERRQDYVSPSSLNLLSVVVKPFPSGDWPNPTRAVVQRQDHRSPPNLNLLGGGLQPFASGEWRNPGRAVERRQDYLGPSNLNLLAPPLPFVGTYWPNPQLVLRSELGSVLAMNPNLAGIVPPDVTTRGFCVKIVQVWLPMTMVQHYFPGTRTQDYQGGPGENIHSCPE